MLTFGKNCVYTTRVRCWDENENAKLHLFVDPLDPPCVCLCVCVCSRMIRKQGICIWFVVFMYLASLSLSHSLYLYHLPLAQFVLLHRWMTFSTAKSTDEDPPHPWLGMKIGSRRGKFKGDGFGVGGETECERVRRNIVILFSAAQHCQFLKDTFWNMMHVPWLLHCVAELSR